MKNDELTNGRRLKVWLAQKGMKNEELAQFLGINKQSISNYLCEKSIPRPLIANGIEELTDRAVKAKDWGRKGGVVGDWVVLESVKIDVYVAKKIIKETAKGLVLQGVGGDERRVMKAKIGRHTIVPSQDQAQQIADTINNHIREEEDRHEVVIGSIIREGLRKGGKIKADGWRR